MNSDINFTYRHNDDQSVALRAILFVVWPIIGVIESVFNFGARGTRTIITLYGFIWGLSLDYSDFVADGYRYAQMFTQFFDMNFNGLIEFLHVYEDYGYNDFYTIISNFIVSRFTHNPSILFGIWGSVYFYFFSSSIYEITQYAKINKLKITKYSPLFLFGLIFLMPLNAINGVRMWTAFMIFFTFSFKAILKSRPKYLAFAASSIFVHFSFIFPSTFLLIFWFVKRKPICIYILLIASLIIATAVPYLIQGYGGIFNVGIENKLYGYSDSEYLERIADFRSQQVWYALYKQDILQYYLYGALIISYWIMRKIVVSHRIVYLFLLSLTLISVYNLTAEVSGGGRYFRILAYGTLAFLVLFKAAIPNNKLLSIYQLIGIIPIGLWTLVSQVNALRSIDLNIALGNIIYIISTYIQQ